ncbi:MAG: ileS, partial [Chlamydiales bacterium]|nr:ileS [Chlamydiales bacterium]
MFESVDQKSFPEIELALLKFWQEKSIFQKSLKIREGSAPFCFYDGPPFATGLPHYGHLLAGTIKDVVPRYQTMKGHFVERRFGWDCHGLPVENEIEKAHALNGKNEIESFGIARFNEECRSIVLRYTEEWKRTVTRMGRWVDFDKTYKTMDRSFMESVWWVFKELHQKGLVYEGLKVMPFSAKLGTPLSNFEASQNYQEVDDPFATVAFQAIDEDVSYLAWTTTPWTLLSNLALTVGPDIEYVKVRSLHDERRYILAASRLSSIFKEGEVEVESSFQGSSLVGKRYHPLFSYFQDAKNQGAFRIISDSFVTLDEGTGIVHTAPAFGEADFYACQKEGIEPVCPVDNNGRFTAAIPEYAGRFVKDADREIIRQLKGMGRLLASGTCRHRYPMCWRSDTPLIYKIVKTWFIKVESIKDRLLKSNAEIYWMPSHIKEGRFGKWLENARDWAVSRNRYWGTPIPIWRADDGSLLVIGSIEELEALTKRSIDDLHRHFIDDLTIEQDGKTYRRVEEVFDCWFESGSMPYAQNHYPFENKELLQKQFPADFIAEGLDQTRGWFYTLTVLSTALFDRPAFKNVIVNGIVLAEDGAKMSKKLRNYPDPHQIIDQYGADAIRLYLLSSPVVKAEDFRFSERGVELVLRQMMIPLWNAHLFLATYAKICRFQPTEWKGEEAPAIDRWMVSLLNRLIQEVEGAMERYDLAKAVEPLVSFIDQLTNWYIRRSRRRFWAEEDSADRRSALSTLYHVLVRLSQVSAPFIPFISEAIYQNLRRESDAESVHLTDFPSYQPLERDDHLESTMAIVQIAVSLGHNLRKEHRLKVRQPLPCLYIVSRDALSLQSALSQEALILEELNVKKIVFSQDEEQFVRLKAKPNFRALGKKVGAKMKEVQLWIESWSREETERFMAEGRAVF